MLQIYDAGQYFTMTPLEGGKMTAVASFIAGLSKDDNNKLDAMFICLSIGLSVGLFINLYQEFIIYIGRYIMNSCLYF